MNGETWTEKIFDDREQILWSNVEAYVNAEKQGGLPGHNLMLMMGKMAKLIQQYESAHRSNTKLTREELLALLQELE